MLKTCFLNKMFYFMTINTIYHNSIFTTYHDQGQNEGRMWNFAEQMPRLDVSSFDCPSGSMLLVLRNMYKCKSIQIPS